MSNIDNRIAGLPSFLYDVIAQIDKLNGQLLPLQSLSSEVLDQMKQSASALPIKPSANSAGDVRGYNELLQNILTHYADTDISVNTIMRMHEQLLKYSGKDKSIVGKYKLLDNKVETKDSNGKVLRVLVEGTPASLAPQALNNLVNWVNTAIDADVYHPLVLISAFISEFLKVHPFIDGNGRLSRMLTNLLLLQAGYDFVPYYPHEHIIDSNREEYYVALSKSQKTFGTESESILTWTEYLLKILCMQAKEAVVIGGVADTRNVPAPSS
jgi:Fic family protein